VRIQLLKSLKKYMDPSTATLFSSLFLGYKKKESLKQQEALSKLNKDFKGWGANHYIARSGLHVAVVTMTWELLLYLAPIPWYARQIILIVLGFIYALLSWPSLSFTRSFVSFIMIKFFLTAKRSCHFLHLLFTILLTLTWFKPILIFFLDFQLTFGLTIALSLFTNITTKRNN